MKSIAHFCVLLLALISVNSRFAVAATSSQSNALIDWLLVDRVFCANAKMLKISEPPNSTRRELTRETFWTDTLAGGIRPKYYQYFMFRSASEQPRDAFEIVFFNDDSHGFYITIPKVIVTEMSATRIAFTYDANYGGESGTGTEARTFEFSVRLNSLGGYELLVSIESKSIWKTIWHLYRPKEIVWRAEMQFESKELPEALIGAAKRISIDLSQYNKIDEGNLRAERAGKHPKAVDVQK
jgi:hypothetical protein